MVTPLDNKFSQTQLAVRSTARNATIYAALCTLLVPGLATAAAWNVDPVRLEISTQQKTAAVTVKNDSDQPTSIQIQAVAWSQVGGKDVYTPTQELLVSPPIVTIAANAEQVIRVGLRRQADASSELSYRISLQELPPQPAPGVTGVQVALRIGLPVFVQPENGLAAPKLLWSVAQMPDRQLKVVLNNQGNAHVQISDFALYLPASEQAIASEAGSSYVLAGQTREWLLKTSAAQSGGPLRLKASTDAGNIETDLVLGRP